MLDSSRRLRVDKSRPSFPPHAPCGQIGTDAVPIATDVQPAAELNDKLAVPQRESSLVVYCGTDQQVSEGFAVALRIMGLDASFLPVGLALATNGPNTEDN
jgi:hypothetical protein